MDRNEILNKSRKENANADLYGNEVREFGLMAGCLAGLVMSMVMFFIEWSINGEKNYGLYTIIASVFATKTIVQSVKLREKTYVVAAVLYTIATIASFVAYVITLV